MSSLSSSIDLLSMSRGDEEAVSRADEAIVTATVKAKRMRTKLSLDLILFLNRG